MSVPVLGKGAQGLHEAWTALNLRSLIQAFVCHALMSPGPRVMEPSSDQH